MRSALTKAIVVLAVAVTWAGAEAPPIEWVRQFPGDGFSIGRWVRQTLDHGFVVVGETHADGAYMQAFIVKTDSTGSLEWSTTLGSGSAFYAVEQTADGGFIACGDSWRKAYLVKLAIDGSLEWERTYTGPNSYARVWSVQQTADGGYVAGGDCYSMWLLRVDSLGDWLWDRQFGDSVYNYLDEELRTMGVCVRQTPDGGFIATGKADSMGLVLIKTDSMGEPTWTRRYLFPPPPQPVMGMSVELTPDGGYVIAAENGTHFGDAAGCKMAVLKTDANGGFLWKRVLGTRGANIAYSAMPTADGGYVAAGLTQSSGTGEGDGCIVKLNSSGQVVWTTTYGMDRYWDYAECAVQTSDGGYAVTGDYGSPASLYLLKLASDASR